MFRGKVRTVGFDADDTLWVNEPFFDQAKAEVSEMMSAHLPSEKFLEVLEQTQSRNIKFFGYGVKSFVISMIDAANQVAPGKLKSSEIDRMIDLGQGMLSNPVEPIEGVEEVLQILGSSYELLLITKGDVAEQQRKINLSGMAGYFDHIEILNEKNSAAYESILRKHCIGHEEFLMVGNSVKSDVLPVVTIGGSAVHIPFHTTWVNEVVCDDELCCREYVEISEVSELLSLLVSS